MTTKKNSFLLKIKPKNEELKFNVNDFIDLFLNEGPFQNLLDQVFGIAPHDFMLNIYNVTFNEGVDRTIIDNVYTKYEEPKDIKLSNNEEITVQVNRPFGYRQIITLYPMPFDVTNDAIKKLTINWSTLKHFEFGKHKKCPAIHNPYLHLYIENLKKSAIPDAINFRNRYISVTIDGEEPKQRCVYCKETNHKIEDCNKRILNETRKQTQPINDTNSYASKLISSSKTREIIQHPSTIFKIQKKAIEKNNLNFPPLSVKNTPTNQSTPPSKPSLSDSSTSSDEQDLSNIDRNNYSAVLLSKPPHSPPLNTPNPPTPTKQIEKSKRKFSLSPASQSTSHTLNPKKKATPKSRLRKNSA